MTMEFKFVNCFIFAAIVLALASTTNADDLSYIHRMAMNARRRQTAAKTGVMENCGKVPFNITWSPDPISPSQVLMVHATYEVPHDMDGGTYNITVWFHDDPTPFVEFADGFDCAKISKFFECPAKKGFKVNITQPFEHIPNIGSYPGDYDVRVEVKNQKGQQMICLKAHVPISKN